MRKMLAVAAAVAVVSLFGGAQAGEPVPDATVSYIGVVGDLTVICTSWPPATPPEVTAYSGIGGGCFDVPVEGANGVAVAVHDSVNTETVGYQIGWYGGEGQIGEFEPGCNSGFHGVPEGATMMKVFVDGPLNGPADCATSLPAGVGVLGTIDVSWFRAEPV